MADYLDPQRCCDLVMKGGVTSGIVYPPAICEIAKQYQLIGIGGTSAGAIAAGMAAAAEYRRRQANDPDRLRTRRRDLTDPGRSGEPFAHLFRPGSRHAQTVRLRAALSEAGQGRLVDDESCWARRGLLKLVRANRTLEPLVENRIWPLQRHG